MLVGLFLMAMDISISDVSVPAIVRSLHIPINDASSIVTVYLVVTASLVVLMGKISDRVGARKTFIIGMVIFAIGSFITGIAMHLSVVLSGRTIQGIGFALTVPSSISLLNHKFPSGAARSLAFSLWTTVIGASMAIGPLVGGWITTQWSWHWAFMINLPIAIVAALGIYFTMEPIRLKIKEKSLDYKGALLLIAGASLLVLGLQSSVTDGWWQSTTPVPSDVLFHWFYTISHTVWYVLLGLLLLGGFFALQSRREKQGLTVVLEVSLFNNPHFTWCTLTIALATGVIMGLLMMVPLYTAYVLDGNAFQAGLALFPLGVGMAIGGPLIAKVTTHAPRRWLLGLFVIQLLSVLALIPVLSVAQSRWHLAIPLIIEGAAWAASYSLLTNTSLKVVPKMLSGVAAGAQMMGRLICAALCTAIMTSITIGYLHKEQKSLDISHLDHQEAQQILQLYHFSGQIYPKIVEPGMTIYQARHIEQFNTIIKGFKKETTTAIQQALAFASIINLLALFCVFFVRKDSTCLSREQLQQVIRHNKPANQAVSRT